MGLKRRDPKGCRCCPHPKRAHLGRLLPHWWCPPTMVMPHMIWWGTMWAAGGPLFQGQRGASLAPSLALTGRCPPTTTQGVLLRLTDARSASKKASCSLPGPKACSAGWQGGGGRAGHAGG